MLALYQYPGGQGLSSISPPCMKVEMALRALGADFRVHNLRSAAAVRRISATGRLPVLEIDGERIADSITILDRLERLYPDAELWPTDAVERLRDRLWDHYATDSLYWPGFYLRWVRPDTSELFRRGLLGRAPWLVRFLVRRTFVPRQRRRALLQGVGGKSVAAVNAEIARGVDTIAAGLEGGPFLQGRDRPGRGDLACVSLLVQAGFHDNMPEAMERIRGLSSLPRFCRDTLDACRMDVPGWLR
jgi:glutathione S-transferase